LALVFLVATNVWTFLRNNDLFRCHVPVIICVADSYAETWHRRHGGAAIVQLEMRVIFTSRGVSESPLAERPANAVAPARKSRLFKAVPPFVVQ
jgi:hypothetical protein